MRCYCQSPFNSDSLIYYCNTLPRILLRAFSIKLILHNLHLARSDFFLNGSCAFATSTIDDVRLNGDYIWDWKKLMLMKLKCQMNLNELRKYFQHAVCYAQHFLFVRITLNVLQLCISVSQELKISEQQFIFSQIYHVL